MRNFFQFIIRYYAIFLFLLLQLISFWLLFSNNLYHNSFFVNSANRFTGNILNTYGNLTTYFYLKDVNDSLLAENASLRAQIEGSIQLDTSTQIAVQDSNITILYTYIPAQVINATYTEANNYLTLNKGSKHGIKKDMGVITSNGIVGIVKSVSQNFSVVISVLHTDFHTRVAVKKNNTQGRLTWQVGNPTIAQMVDVSEPGALFIGDTIITTAYSSIFPPNMMIGTVETFNKDEGSNFYTIDVKLSTQFSSLKYVYVINYLRGAEKLELEMSAENEVDAQQ